MEALLKQFMGQMDKRFDQMDKRFEEMDKRFDEVDMRFEKIDKRFDGVDVRFETIDKRFDGVNARFDKVEKDIASLKEEVRNNQTENRSHFKFIETKLDEHNQTFHVVADELKGVKIDITYLNRKSGEHDLSLNNLIQRYHT